MNEINFPRCKNAEAGCTFEAVTKEATDNHLKGCHYRSVPCPHMGCGEVVLVAEVVDHLKTKHFATEAKSPSNTVKFNVQPFLEDDSKIWAPVVIVLKGRTFVGSLIKAKGNYFAWLAALSDDESPRPDVEIALRGSKSIISSLVTPVNIGEDVRPEDSEESDLVLTFTTRQARHSLRRGSNGEKILKLAFGLQEERTAASSSSAAPQGNKAATEEKEKSPAHCDFLSANDDSDEMGAFV